MNFRKIVFAVAILAALSFARRTFAGTYYVDCAGGSDSNNGVTEGTPWLHPPVAPNFTGSYSHSAGDHFYFRGGVTCGNATMGWNINNGGSSGNPDYYGPDPQQQWYAGSSWSRPIMDAQGAVTAQNNNMFNILANYVTLDNFEVKGLYWTGSTQYATVFSYNTATYVVVEHMYVHDFLGSATAGPSGSVVPYVAVGVAASNYGGSFLYNVVDGSDGSGGGNLVSAVYEAPPDVEHNVLHDLCNAINIDGGTTNIPGLSTPQEVSYNLIYNIDSPNQPTQCTVALPGTIHPNAIEFFTISDVHDNVIHDTYGVTVYGGPCSGSTLGTTNIYNNVMYHNGPVPIQISCGTPGGTANVYNNTLEPDSVSGATGNPAILVSAHSSGQGYPPATLNLANNHFITNTGTPLNSVCVNNPPYNSGTGCAGVTTVVECGVTNPASVQSCELTQTMAAANAQGYSASEVYAYSPTASTDATVGKGTLMSTLMSLLQGISSLATGLTTDTTYGVGYANNTASGGRATNSRIGTSDVGAYQFGSGSTSTAPQPPLNVSAIVQ